LGAVVRPLRWGHARPSAHHSALLFHARKKPNKRNSEAATIEGVQQWPFQAVGEALEVN